MAITRTKKDEIIKELHDKADKSKVAVFLNFHDMSAGDMSDLRKQFRSVGADMKVAKKTLLKKVFAGLGYTGEIPKLEGETAVVFGYEESPEIAKVSKGFSKSHKGLAILGGAFDSKYVLADFVDRLASLPGREVLIAQAVGLIASPLRGLVGAAGAPIRSLVGIISQLSKTK